MVGRLFMRGYVMSTYGGSTLHKGVCNEYLGGSSLHEGVCNEYLWWVVAS